MAGLARRGKARRGAARRGAARQDWCGVARQKGEKG